MTWNRRERIYGEDKEYSKHIKRDNLKSFLECSRCILDILCSASFIQPYHDEAWKELRERLSCAIKAKIRGNI